MATEIYLGDLPHNKGIEAVWWCVNVFGPGQVFDDPKCTGRWRVRDLAYIEFKNDKDATMFMLRWAGG